MTRSGRSSGAAGGGPNDSALSATAVAATGTPGTFDELDRPDEVSRFMAEPISKFMNTAVLSVEPEDELRDVVDLMLENKIGAVPVVEPDSLKLVGIVSYIDVLSAVRDDL